MTDKIIFNARAWNNAIVVDIPYLPFLPEKETETKIIDYVANRLLQIARDEKRTAYNEGEKPFEKNQHFLLSNTLVAIDASSINEDGLSYLNHLIYITRLHPCVIINCNISKDELLGSDLNRRLEEANYILPVFRRIPAADALSFNDRYGKSLFSLISGNVESLSRDQFEFRNDKYSEEDLLNRFPGLYVHENNLFHKPDIVWLGAKTEEYALLLDYLFNHNIELFHINKECKKFSVEIELFNKYFRQKYPCMLFGTGSDREQSKFRLLKKSIYPKLMHSIMHQLEDAMIEVNAIDTTHGSYPGFRKEYPKSKSNEIVEYHSVGKVFQQKDTFSCKLLYYIRQSLELITFDSIVVVDNGRENDLVELLPKIFPINSTNIIRIVNYFSNPVLYPFDKLSKNSNVIIITDVINTGSLLNKVLLSLQKYNVAVKAIFAFISDIALSRSKLFNKIKDSEQIRLFSFTEKKLANITMAQEPEHRQRFSMARSALSRISDGPTLHSKFPNNFSSEAFLSFWYHADLLCNANTKISNCITKLSNKGVPEINIKSTWTHELQIGDEAVNLFEEESELYQFLNWLLNENGFTSVCLVDSRNGSGFRSILHKIKPSVKIYNLEDLRKLNPTNKNLDDILIVYLALNIGITLKDAIETLKLKFNNNIKLSCFSLFCRKNIIEETAYISSEYLDEISKLGIPVYCYYVSSLPYYITDIASGTHTLIHSKLSSCHNL